MPDLDLTEFRPLRVCTPDQFLAADAPERRKLVLAQIDATPYDWLQSDWVRTRFSENPNSCGTAFCAAGWATELAGWFGDRSSYATIETDAAELLGLTYHQHRLLFNGSNDRETLDEIIAVLNDPDPQAWPDYAAGLLVDRAFREIDAVRASRHPADREHLYITDICLNLVGDLERWEYHL